MRAYRSVFLLLGVVGACASPRESRAQAGPEAQAGTCTVEQALIAIPDEVRETSGLAAGRRNPDVFWTHNDSGFEPFIFALGPDGVLKARVRVTGATVTDWEDIEISECAGGSCLYIADIGDNAGRRSVVTIYEVQEPDLTATEVAPVRVIRARYADGPQDAEAFVKLPGGEMFVVSKGRHGAVKLYRYSAAGANGEGTLQLVREIAPRPGDQLDRVTAATSSPDGKWVAIRTYRNLQLYRVADLTANGGPALTYSLTSLGEKQGESITLSNDGTLWLTSEAENRKDKPTIGRLRCVLP
jgi:hypothetical protein